MSKRYFFIVLAAAALFLGMVACEFSASTANIKEAWLSFDQDGEQRTEVFGQDDVFYAQVLLANAPDETNVKTVWVAVDVENTDPDFVIYETEIASGDADLYFELSNDNLWPFGLYRADIYLNGELDRSLDFTVQ